MAHTCNPSNSGGRDQEYHSSKPASGKQFQDTVFFLNSKDKKVCTVAQVERAPA
jgi:hypothetical protein